MSEFSPTDVMFQSSSTLPNQGAWAEIVNKAASDAAAGNAKARDWLSKYLMPQPGAGEGGGLRPLVVEFVEAIPSERELVEDQR